MLKYLEYSQQVKREVEANPIFIRRVQGFFSGRELELIGSGDSHSVYRLGELSSGIWVAVRVNTQNIPPEWKQTYLEYWCREAGRLYEEGKKVPEFGIAVSYHGATGNCSERGNCALLVQDLTEGGKKGIVPVRWEKHGIDAETGEQVFYDLHPFGDVDYNDLYKNPVFFKKSNRMDVR